MTLGTKLGNNFSYFFLYFFVKEGNISENFVLVADKAYEDFHKETS